MIPDIVVSSAIFFGLGLGLGVVTQFLHDCRYTTDIKNLYEKMLAEKDKKLETQKTSIDRLIQINNQIQSDKCHAVKEVRYVKKENKNNEQR